MRILGCQRHAILRALQTLRGRGRDSGHELEVILIDSVLSRIVYFFFFQAEDGIRDKLVTGVQTCALPICHRLHGGYPAEPGAPRPASGAVPSRPVAPRPDGRAAARADADRKEVRPSRRRSEERRVGKECRSRWSPYH